MPVEVDCHCGSRFPVSEALAGLSIRCRECGSSVTVPRPGGSAPETAPPPPPRAVAKPQEAASPAPSAAKPAPAPAPSAPSAAELKGASSSYNDQPSAAGEEDGWFSGGVIGGLGIILVAAIWFIVGLALGRIFFYPIIMVVIGIFTLIKSVLDRE